MLCYFCSFSLSLNYFKIKSFFFKKMSLHITFLAIEVEQEHISSSIFSLGVRGRWHRRKEVTAQFLHPQEERGGQSWDVSE